MNKQERKYWRVLSFPVYIAEDEFNIVALLLPSCTSLELNGPALRQEAKQGYLTSPKKGSKETKKILDFRLQEVSEASLVSLHQKQERVRAFVCHNDVDYRGYSGLDERLSVMPIDQADTYLSDKRAERAIVVVRLAGSGVLRLVMGLWVTAGPLIVSSALPRPPMSQSECRTYSNTDSHQLKIAHKGQMI